MNTGPPARRYRVHARKARARTTSGNVNIGGDPGRLCLDFLRIFRNLKKREEFGRWLERGAREPNPPRALLLNGGNRRERTHHDRRRIIVPREGCEAAKAA